MPQSRTKKRKPRSNKNIISSSMLILAIVGASALLVAQKDNPGTHPAKRQQVTATQEQAPKSPGSATTEGTVSQPQPNQPTTKASPAQTNEVAIEGSAFSPAHITIRRGTAVTWTNNDNTQHTITSPSNVVAALPGPNSPPLNKGDSYTFTFKDVGTFPYSCVFHPSVEGSVVVTP